MRFLKKYYKLIGSVITLLALVFVVKKLVTMDVDWSAFCQRQSHRHHRHLHADPNRCHSLHDAAVAAVHPYPLRRQNPHAGCAAGVHPF